MKFVFCKVLEYNLILIVIVNKIDCLVVCLVEVIDEVFDLFIELGVSDEQFEFFVVYVFVLNGIFSMEDDFVK